MIGFDFSYTCFKGTKGKKKGGAKVSLAGGKATKKSTIVDHDDFNDMGAEFDDFMWIEYSY